MNNVKLMEIVMDMYFQTLHTREQSRRISVQSAILRKVYDIKEWEIVKNKAIQDYERAQVLTDEEIEEELYKYIGFWEWAINKNDPDKARSFKNEIYYFIDAVELFDPELAETFTKTFNEIDSVA